LALPLAVVGALPAQAQAPRVQPRLEIGRDRVSVAEVTRGGKVVLFGVDRVVGEDDYPTTFVTREIVVDADEDGAVELRLGHPVPPRRAWMAVDLASGLAVSHLPTETGQRRVALQARGVHRREAARDAVEDTHALLDLMLVRRGVGAWGGRVLDGSKNDGDRTPNGRLVAFLDALEPVGDSPSAPERVAKDDWLLAVDPIGMDAVVAQVAGETAP
jgi:hypothetical protein